MRYLAKVERASFLGGAALQLLAQQVQDYLWEKLSQERTIETDTVLGFSEGVLVITEVDEEKNEILTAVDASPWVMELVDVFLSRGITPEFLEQEVERAEQWRQSLTLESQEVERRALETAARRDEIQELEKSLKVERSELEQREAELRSRLDSLGA
jgi:hypothetical protein